MALPDSYSGIIAALKIKSGSQKFYKPNFQGVIEAILDWTGGGGAEIIYPPTLPPTDGNDGDIIGIPNADGDWFIYIWADGGWQPIHILTTDVLPNPPGGMPGRSIQPARPIYTPEGEELTNQQDINWYLYNNLGSEARPEMVYYGVTPPDTAPEGALFTDEDSVKQFVHQGNGVWVEITHWTGNGEAGELRPWIRIEDLRVVREYYGPTQSNSPDGFVAKIMIYEFDYEDERPSTVTQEWEWDEVGDGNWVPLDLMSDPNITAAGYQTYYYWLYNWAPENSDDNTGLDPNHPFPCAKVRVRMNNAWDDGTNENSEWMECWIGKAASPKYGTPHQPPSVC